ncbi:Zinc ABC transporter, permease protein ZnuB [Candidatus Syntrophocurvum alkaliphilum]|uniref:Zinc ABC transporter, permease protein ZnuB n=1 Tax=Candidatus Syntrophocurvum alkaliphilum TaxID=2293317 RepID=A0A6I6D5Q6_9FIRM|nr:metal ABC transporter permease [Candidatus Syntrophocurvum alkaliphilum]QGT98706.1 Zinc ABC transporter, permease protein ZnuB [Candidatus Syntrophocurvum alkaliphilum]
MDILQYEFMRNALLVGILASIACGIIGSYVVVKRLVFISGSISHTAYGGIGLGYFLGYNPMLGAGVFTLISALAMGVISQKTTQREDTIIGMMWAVGMAIGIIFISLSSGYTSDLMSYLFGNILTVPSSDLYLVIAMDLIIIAVVVLFFEELKAYAFDEEYAKVSGVKTERLNLVLLCLIALTVIVMMRVVGIILVIALLTMPPAVATHYTWSLKSLMIISGLLGILFTTSGLIISYFFNIPSGATIILVAGAVFLISYLTTYFKQTVELRNSIKDHNINI